MNISVTISSDEGYVETSVATDGDGVWPPEMIETVLTRCGTEALRLHRERTTTPS